MNASDPPSSLVTASSSVALSNSVARDAMPGAPGTTHQPPPVTLCPPSATVDTFHALAQPLGSSTSRMIHSNNQIVSDTTITSTQLGHQPLIQQTTVPVQGVIVQSSPQLPVGLPIKGKYVMNHLTRSVLCFPIIITLRTARSQSLTMLLDGHIRWLAKRSTGR